MSGLEQLHDRARELGLRPTRLAAKGFRCSCPLCGGNEPAAIAAGNVQVAVAHCHKCGDGIGILRALGGNGARLLPSERVARTRAQNDEARAARARLTGLADMVRPFAGGDIPTGLLWDPQRMPDTGMIGSRAAFIIRDDAGAVIGLDLYAMPGTVERELALANGHPKLQAAAGSTRGMWPPPKSTPDSMVARGLLLLVEGSPCAATLLGVGFMSCAYPNAAGLRDHEVGRVLASHRNAAIVVLADADEVGRAGAVVTARKLRARGADVRAIDLFPGRTDGYDVADALRMHDPADAAGWLLGQTKELRT